MVSLQKVIQGIGSLNEKAMGAARERQDSLTKPQGSLGEAGKSYPSRWLELRVK